MINAEKLTVAVPWSLSHFIPLNGFHALYRALFDQRPGTVSLYAFDNVKLFNALQKNMDLRSDILKRARQKTFFPNGLIKNKIARAHLDYYGKQNRAMTGLLPGQLEFLHTAPFPTFQRPFVFHCEMFAPVFFPFHHQGTGRFGSLEPLRNYFAEMFSHPLCLGIFSHIPETIKSFGRFFQSKSIDRKLRHSKIGLSTISIPIEPLPNKGSLASPKFLFFNSAHQNPSNFWGRGGHIALRFWKEFLASGKNGSLYLRCARPREKDLLDHGVDVEFLRCEEGRSIFWIEKYLSNNELNSLTAQAHFFLLPSISLHSASIMQALAFGAVPVVTDTVGTSRYVVDDQNGIVLKGVFLNIWRVDPETGVLFDTYRQNEALDKELVGQLVRKILALLNAPNHYERIRSNAITSFRENFSGNAFSSDFWSSVNECYAEHSNASQQSERAVLPRRLSTESDLVLSDCFLGEQDWSRVFESCPQPVLKFYSGFHSIYELGGAFLRLDSEKGVGTPKMGLHDWSPLKKYSIAKSHSLVYARDFEDAVGGIFEQFNSRNDRRGLLFPLKKSVKTVIAMMRKQLAPLNHWAWRVPAASGQFIETRMNLRRRNERVDK